MNHHQLLTDLLQRLDNDAQRRATLEAYYRGNQPLAYLSPEARAAIGARFGVMASNIPRLAVTALAERLRVTGFRTDGQSDPQLWADWIGNDLDQLAGVAHREALTLGESYLIVWGDQNGPRVTVESADQVAVLRDPGTRQIVAAVKRWETKTTTEAVLYGPDKIVRLRANSVGATTAGFNVVEVVDNPFGIPPVVALRNNDRLTGCASSEIDDLVPLVDALNKTLADMLVTSEYLGRPRRWATGIELVEDDDGNPVNPIPDGNRTMLSESPDTKFGQLPAADLGAYESSVRILLGQISAVSALPAHYLGILGDQPPSADSLRAAEASLTARAEARQATFGRAWEQVARLMVAARTGADPASVDVAVSWADAATRSIAQEADAVVKLYTAGLLPVSAALARLGYTETEIAEIRAQRRAEVLAATPVDLSAVIQ